MSNKPKRGIPENEPEPTIKDVLKQIQLLDVKNNKSITDMMKQQSDQLLKKIQDSQKKLKDEIKIDIAALTEKFDAVEENICSNNQQVASISSEVIDLRIAINILKQDKLAKNMVVNGFPDLNLILLKEKFLAMCGRLEVTVLNADVVNIFKVKTRNAMKLVVKLTSHYLRNSILEGRKNRSIFTDELGVRGMRNQLFLQEDFTKMNQKLPGDHFGPSGITSVYSSTPTVPSFYVLISIE
jgi:uncharacterized protein YunC (DUF1805 family)